MRGFRDGLLSVLPGMHPIRAEPARRGAGKGCYGKWFLMWAFSLRIQGTPSPP